MNRRYLAVAERAGHRCEYCLAPEAAFNLIFEVEHVVPPGRSGSHEFFNLALACRSCNLFKSDRTDAFDAVSASVVRLFDPRTDRWNDHFFLAPEGRIEGRTDIGRATAYLLQFNSGTHLAARKLWLRIGLFASET